MGTIEAQHGIAAQRQRLYLDEPCSRIIGASETVGATLKHGQVLRLREVDTDLGSEPELAPRATHGVPATDDRVVISDGGVAARASASSDDGAQTNGPVADTPAALSAIPVSAGVPCS
jgi:hypothetical protein